MGQSSNTSTTTRATRAWLDVPFADSLNYRCWAWSSASVPLASGGRTFFGTGSARPRPQPLTTSCRRRAPALQVTRCALRL